MSECNTCVWACRDGSCASWDCEYINQNDAAKAYRQMKEKQDVGNASEGW